MNTEQATQEYGTRLIYSLDDLCYIAASLALNEDLVSKTFVVASSRFFGGGAVDINRVEPLLDLIERTRSVCERGVETRHAGCWNKEWLDKIQESYNSQFETR